MMIEESMTRGRAKFVIKKLRKNKDYPKHGRGEMVRSLMDDFNITEEELKL